jgi:hypothetical protein
MQKCFQINPTDLELFYTYNTEYQFPFLTKNSFAAGKILAQSFSWNAIPLKKHRFLFNGICPLFFELCCEKKYFNTLFSYGLVAKDTIDRARQVFETEDPPSNTDDNLNKLYRVGFEVAHSILKIFWRPSDYLQKEIDVYFENYFQNNFVIGIQLRYSGFNFKRLNTMFYNFHIFRYFYSDWVDTAVFIQCALDLEKFAKKPVRWFVTSDNETNLLKVSMNYSSRVFTSNGTIGHFAKGSQGHLRTLLDVELLSMCDEVIITGGSTYGFLSSLRSGKYPLFVNGRVKSSNCERFSFSNPSLTPGPVHAVV